MKFYIKYTSFFILTILIFCLLINLLYFYNLINQTLYRFLILISSISITYIFGIILSKSKEKKGYIFGLKYGLIIISIMFFLSILLFKNINFYMIPYYSIIILTSITAFTLRYRHFSSWSIYSIMFMTCFIY